MGDAVACSPSSTAGYGSCSLALQPQSDFLGPQGTLRYIRNARGTDLAAYFWPACNAATKGVVVLVHGHGSYLTYDYLRAQGPGLLAHYRGSWVQRLNEAGYAVCGIDNQGSGRSGGLRCYAERFEHLVDDVLQLARCCHSLGVPGFTTLPPPAHRAAVPRFLLGGSLGGCIATVAAMTQPDLFAGVVLLAPMLSLEKVARRGLNPYLRPLSSIASVLIPTWPLAKTNKNVMYPDLQLLYDSDPNCWHEATRVRNAAEYLRICAALMVRLEQVTFPVLVFHSERDDMTDCEGSKALYMRAKSADKTLKLCSTFWHILTKEPGNEAILAEVTAWLDLRV